MNISNYFYRVADASIFANNVQLLLEANKFFCKNSKCSRRVFTERFNRFINTYGRITCRLEDLLSKLSFELSAEKLAKLSNALGVNRSADYFLRLIRKISKNKSKAQSIHIGVDDFAFRKGVSYGTIVCDLDTRKPIDLINSRNTLDFKEWLLINPQIKIVSRDRATTYTKAISEVNPTIIQISDKWHVMKNLLDILKEIISHEFPNSFYETSKINTPKETHTMQLTDKQKTKWKVILNIKKLHAEGSSERAISKATGLHRKTVSKYLKLEHAPQRKRISGKSMLDEYREHINGILEGNVNRVKTIKRIMYGRANFDLLKAKVLYSL